jgi:hypothetical protein
MAARPITEEDRRRVKALHAAGRNRNQIAKEIGRSGSTVSKIAEQLGLSFNRDAVQAATEARVADAKARRAELMHALLDDAQKLRQQLFAPTTIHSFGGKDNTYASRDVNQPLFKDQRDIMQATNTAITASLRIDDHDANTGDTDAAKSMLGSLAAGLQAAYDQMQTQPDPDDDRDD